MRLDQMGEMRQAPTLIQVVLLRATSEFGCNEENATHPRLLPLRGGARPCCHRHSPQGIDGWVNARQGR